MTSKNTASPEPLTGGLGRGIHLACDSLFSPSFKASNPFYFGSRNVVLVTFLKKLPEVNSWIKSTNGAFTGAVFRLRLASWFRMGRW